MAGNVQQPTFGIVRLHAIQRSLAGQGVVARPGILLDLIEQAHLGAVRELPRAGQCLGSTDVLDPPAAARIDRQQRTVAVVQQIARRASGTRQTQTERRARVCAGGKRCARCDAAIGTQRLQARQVLLWRQLGVADEEHHHAADDPEQDKQAEPDTQPAVREIQIALHAAQKSRVTAAYSERPSPGACSVSAPSYQTYS